MKRQKNRQRNNEVKTFMKRCNLRSGVTPFYKGFDNTYMEIFIKNKKYIKRLKINKV